MTEQSKVQDSGSPESEQAQIEEYQIAPFPEPDDERPVDEPLIDPEAPLDAHDELPEDDA